MITNELAKQLIEQAEYNCSGEKVEYNIDDIQALSEDDAYLVFASSESCKTVFNPARRYTKSLSPLILRYRCTNSVNFSP